MISYKKSIRLFRQVVNDVPAYREYLLSKNFNPNSVKRENDFFTIPSTNKNEYLKAYPFSQLMWKGELARPILYCSTSGSTGEPFYFPREEVLSEQYSYVIEDFINNSSHGKGPTLVIIGFGMGVWIGGIITLRAFEIAAKRANLPVSILPAGYNKTEIIKALKKLSGHYAQTVLVGYPPFVKDVIDEALAKKIDFNKLNLRILFAAESFTESFRDYLGNKAQVSNLLRDTLNIYGSADIGAMAAETPLSILLRRILLKKPKAFHEIFDSGGKTPTLAQFNPEHVIFEEKEGQLLLTGDSSIPLIRYEIGDHGGVYEYKQLERLLAQQGINLRTEAKKYGIEKTIREYPFVYVYERADFTASLHGINIYPEFIKEALIGKELSDYVTEKFTMVTKTNRRHNQYLEVNIELKGSVQPTPEQKKNAHKLVVDTLKDKSSEFQEISKTRNPMKMVKLVFWPLEHQTYFKPGTKQKWVTNS